jgi:glutamate-ammonia-ligase adenylyltransferase
MQKVSWKDAAGASADPARAAHFFELLAATDAAPQLEKFSAPQLGVLAAVFAGSPFLGGLLVAHPDWLPVLDLNWIEHPRTVQGFQREIGEWLEPKLAKGDHADALAALRRFKQRELLRIGARDLARLGDVVEVTRELSDVADASLDAVLRICWRELAGRLGVPCQQDETGRWRPTGFCVLGLGKLGGQELNYSSDVDLLFVYGDEGQVFKELPPHEPRAGRDLVAGRTPAGTSRRCGSQTPAPAKDRPPRPALSNHQFFCKLAEAFVAEVSRTTADGFLFRVDLRLRPEGDTGPLARSLDSCENYYAEWGQTWERMMLIKARPVAGDESVAAEFLEMIQPFRFPRAISENILAEIAAAKDRTEKEIVGTHELRRNVKLGRGGIREIEFVVQSLQVLHGGQLPFLQLSQTLPCLAKLPEYELLGPLEARQLDAAYRFLRDVEHRLQMENNRQTHTIPDDPAAWSRLARLMGCASPAGFQAALETHTGAVRRVYDRLLRPPSPRPESGLPAGFIGAEAQWRPLLAARSFRDPDAAFRRLKEFAEGPGYVHVSPRTTELARRLIPMLLALCPEKSPAREPGARVLSDPDRVLTRMDSFISAYGSRAALVEMWNNHPAMFRLMLLLFDRSEFLAETAIRAPDLVENLVTTGRLRQRKFAPEMLKDLRHGRADADQFLWLRQYHEVERMRLGLRDILGLAGFEQNLTELSALADACLQYALEAVMRRNRLRKPPFAIVGLGKLGGCEIDYGSDLDIIFVTGAIEKDLTRLGRLARQVLELLSRRTERGIVLATDTRLRPDGEKGLLVNTLEAFEDYYHERAQLWEIQALTRVRVVAGDFKVGEKYQKLAASLADFSASGHSLAAARFGPDWKNEIHRMRMRIEKERTPAGKDDLAIKTGRGGLMDAEFVAQALCLEHGWTEPNTLRALERARDANILPDADALIENYRRLRRVEGILRRWSYEGETVLPDDPAPYYRVAVRCGYATPEEFGKALAGWRHEIRLAYKKVFNT